MADEKLMVDTTILIDYFRKTDKDNSALVKHSKKYSKLYISCITEFEVINGATGEQLDFWNLMLQGFTVLDFDRVAARKAAEIVAQLKRVRKNIDKPDLFIAATAIVNDLTIDTFNKKHFNSIENIRLLGANLL